MAFSGNQDDDEVMSEINMIPLVDVMLVLLIIFMLTVPVLTHSVQIDLPRAENRPNELTPETVTISVTRGGQVHWNDQAITEDVLMQRLHTVSQQQPQPDIHLRGDRQVDYEHVVKVMAAVQRAGILKLGFVTEAGE